MDGSITAIVPTYNRSRFLGEALAALAAQTRPPAEIIVWDDGSQDATGDVVRAAPGPVRYFRSENGGKSRALNAALAEARGDYIWICDDDDIVLPAAAEVLAAPLDADETLGISGGAYRRFRDDPQTGTRVERGPGYWPDLRHGSVLRHLLEDIFLFQNAMLVRRSCYAATGPFREDLARSIDYDMLVRLAVRFPVTMTEQVVFLQRKHDGVRGPAAARHAATQSEAVWKAADRAVFAPFRETVPLTLYEAMYEGADPEAVRRAALLQRGCVYARRTDWNAALDDFAAAAALRPEAGLTDTERAICRRAVSGKHGCAEISGAEVRDRLASLAGDSAAGSGIVRALLRGLVWRLREALWHRDARALGQLSGIFARLGTVGAGRRGTPLANQTERQRLPLDTYGYGGPENA